MILQPMNPKALQALNGKTCVFWLNNGVIEEGRVFYPYHPDIMRVKLADGRVWRCVDIEQVIAILPTQV